MIIIVIVIVIVIVKEPYPSAVIIAISIEFFTCPTLSACSWSDVYVEKTTNKAWQLRKSHAYHQFFLRISINRSFGTRKEQMWLHHLLTDMIYLMIQKALLKRIDISGIKRNI